MKSYVIVAIYFIGIPAVIFLAACIVSGRADAAIDAATRWPGDDEPSK